MRISISRRRILGLAGALLTGKVPGRATARRNQEPAPHRIILSENNAVAETTYGKVRGYTEGGVHTFKGIPYGGSTSGDGRFMPHRPPTKWAGVRDCLEYGPISPQWQGNRAQTPDHIAFLFQAEPWFQDEDCLTVNVWTPAHRSATNRPVLVWLHGGGFFGGSSFEFPSYDGRNLADHGDVVVVSVNHRLNVLGFLNLSRFHERYEDSANVGMLDVIAALRWVRDNIGQFGGDPGNVTVFGQSGGGAKVNYLMTMPSAKGLFHKAVVMSAIPKLPEFQTAEQTALRGAAVIRRLGLEKSGIDELQKVSHARLAAAWAETASEAPALVAPSIDGRVVPSAPFVPAATDISADIPLLVGNTLHEGAFIRDLTRDALTDAQLRKEAAQMHGPHAPALINSLRAIYPSAKPVEVLGHMRNSGGLDLRVQTVIQAVRKSIQRAPVYAYSFEWRTPVLDGRLGAFHRSELPFFFDNTDRCAHMTGGTAAARSLGEKVSGALIRFARTGNPNHASLPHWPAFRADTVPTMIFDDECEVKFDHDRAAREAYQQAVDGRA